MLKGKWNRVAAVLLTLSLGICTFACSKNDKVDSYKEEIPEVDVEEPKEEKLEDKPIYIKKHPYKCKIPPRNDSATSLDEIANGSSLGYLDLRSRDLSNFQLNDSRDRIIKCDFDDKTIWPEEMPEGFNPKEFMEFHKKAQLGIDELHAKGITGKGVGYAIVDMPLFIDHSEFKDRIMYYDELQVLNNMSSAHSCEMLSIGAGRNIGIASEADIYAMSCLNISDDGNNKSISDYTWSAKSIRKLIELNKDLPEDKKIRVISVSLVCPPSAKGYDELIEAFKEAKKENIFVIYGDMMDIDERFYFQGLDIEPLADQDMVDNYNVIPFDFWCSMVKHIDGADEYYKKRFSEIKPDKVLLVPINSRTLASPTGKDDYVYCYIGGVSSSMPYIAGVYALVCQVYPKITPEEFWDRALETGDKKEFDNNGVKCDGRIINPVKLVESFTEN